MRRTGCSPHDKLPRVLLALTSGQKTGLAVVAAAFVVFALASSFLFPRFAPDFPGRWLKLFVVVCLLFTVGMLAAVIGFGKESEEKGAQGTEPATTVVSSPPAAGDAVAGKKLFTDQACGGCHTFAPAASKGAVGPNLDELAASAEKAGRGSLPEFVHESIADPNAYIAPGYPGDAMPKFGAILSPKQIDDLVAFLTAKS